MNLNLKDIVAINQEFHNGKLANEGSLAFALSYARRTTNWVKALAIITRAILIDHAFEDGNKRTAAAVIFTEAHMQGFTVNKNRLAHLIEAVLRKNVTSTRELEEMIKDVIK